MRFIINGAVLVVLGLILWVFKNKKEGKSLSLEMMETTPIKYIVENFEHITHSMGRGYFSNHFEVKGKAHANSPLISELSDEPVVYYCSEVVHEYEKLETKTNSDGKKEKNWVKHQDTVSQNKRCTEDFGVKDDKGYIGLNPNKSKLHLGNLFSKFEKGEPSSNGDVSMKIKGFSISFGSSNNGLRTIGYRYSEAGILMGANLYLAGDANDRDGRLEISLPRDKKSQFILSVKSEEELLRSLSSAAKGLKIGAFISLGLLAAAIVYGIIKTLS